MLAGGETAQYLAPRVTPTLTCLEPPHALSPVWPRPRGRRAGAQLLVTLQAALVFGGADIDLAVGEIGESGAVPHFQVGQHLGAAEVGGGSSGGGRGFLGEGGGRPGPG